MMNLAMKRTKAASRRGATPVTHRSASDQGLKLIRAVRIRISARNDRWPAGQRCLPTQRLVMKPVSNMASL